MTRRENQETVVTEAPSDTPPGAPGVEVRDMFAHIAPTYDMLNRLLSVGRDRVWRRVTARALDSDAGRILDLCSGTGDLAFEVANGRPKALVCAGDFCFEMLARGQEKGLGHVAAPVACDASCLPFATGTFDAVTVAFGVRNFEDLETGLRETHRVLRPGGQLVVLEFFRHTSRWCDWPFQFYFRHVLPRLGRLVSGHPGAYTYLPRSVGRFTNRDEFERLLRQIGFDNIRRRRLDLGIVTLFTARTR